MAKHKSFGALLALSGTWDKTLFYRYISGFVPAPGGAAEGDAGMASCFSLPPALLVVGAVPAFCFLLG